MRHAIPGAALALALVLCAASAGAVADAGIPTYTAVYSAQYKGKNVGTSEFSVTYDAKQDQYEFQSRTMVKGLLKLFSPKPAVDRSLFKVSNGKIAPLEFWHEDGSRRGENDVHVTFDWPRHIAVVSDKSGRREMRIEDGTVDRGCIQVALMRDLIMTGKPQASYLMADGDSVSPYEYVDNGETTTKTGLGDLKTRAFVQHREGSSRTTTLQMAPSLSYLPARIEQSKNGELQTAFTLESVEGLAGAPTSDTKQKK